MIYHVVPDNCMGEEGYSIFADGAYCGRVAPDALGERMSELSARATGGISQTMHVSADELAECFQVCRRTVTTWTADGMPHERTRRRELRFNLGACREWLQGAHVIPGDD